MKKSFFYIFALGLIFFLASCNEDKGLTISGNLPDSKNMKIHLYKNTIGKRPEVIMSQSIDENGTYKIQLPTTPEIGWYQIRVGSRGAELLLDGTESDIVINGNMADFAHGKIEVKGSGNTQTFYDILTKVNKKEIAQDDLPKYLDNQEPLVAYVIGGMMYGNHPSTVVEQEKISKRLTEKYGDSQLAKDYAKKIENMKIAHARMMAKEKVKPGMPAPDIALPNPEGKIIKLSDYKGKLVLLDFWAAWCGPCRKNNPKLVALYNKYKDQGFDIFSVSLDGPNRAASNASQAKLMKDRAKEKWVAAIAKDGLIWKGHVSDLKFWQSAAAATYGVTAIPKTYLISKEGKIIAVNPHGNLEELIKANL